MHKIISINQKYISAKYPQTPTADCRWGKHGRSWWLCQDAGGGRGYWLTLICFVSTVHSVSIGSQGPGISSNMLGLPSQFGLNPADILMLWPLLTQTSAIMLILIMCQVSTLTKAGSAVKTSGRKEPWVPGFIGFLCCDRAVTPCRDK